MIFHTYLFTHKTAELPVDLISNQTSLGVKTSNRGTMGRTEGDRSLPPSKMRTFWHLQQRHSQQYKKKKKKTRVNNTKKKEDKGSSKPLLKQCPELG